MYGNQLKKFVFTNTNKKSIFSRPFYKSLNSIELRLKIFVLRLRFAFKLLEVQDLIKKGFVKVNGQIKKPNYIVKVGDILSLTQLRFFKPSSERKK